MCMNDGVDPTDLSVYPVVTPPSRDGCEGVGLNPMKSMKVP